MSYRKADSKTEIWPDVGLLIHLERLGNSCRSGLFQLRPFPFRPQQKIQLKTPNQ